MRASVNRPARSRTCFRARDEHVAADLEGQAVKLGFAKDVLDRLAGHAALNELDKETGLLLIVEHLVPAGKEGGAVAANDMEQQGLRVAAGAVGVRSLAKLGLAFPDPLLQGHQAAWLSAFNCSAW